jgi:hypothetical protein
MCRCLSAKYRVSRPRALEWLRPSVLAYAWKVVLARKLAPWLEQRLPGALKYVEKLVI